MKRNRKYKLLVSSEATMSGDQSNKLECVIEQPVLLSEPEPG